MVPIMPATLLLTRPDASAQDFAAQAMAAGWRGPILCAPLMRIVPRAVDGALVAGAGTWIATSQHAVAVLADTTGARDRPLYCVGPRTAQEARARGFAQLRQAGGDGAASLAQVLADSPPQPILHLHGEHLALDIAAGLRARGVAAEGRIAYGQIACPLGDRAVALLRAPGAVVVPVFSPRSARLLVQQVAQITDLKADLHIVAISESTAGPLAALRPARLHTSPRPEGDALLRVLLSVQAELEAAANPR